MEILQAARLIRLISKSAGPLANGLGFRRSIVKQAMTDVVFRPLVYEQALSRFKGRGNGNEYDMVIFLLEHGLFRTIMRKNDTITERLFETLLWWKKLGLYHFNRSVDEEWLKELKEFNNRGPV